ncbi:NAD-dependent protein deacetylase [Streptomyces sp. NPDC088923]|uniref:NAD-dependent protein deacetylase n=1 Tax=Streptomyces sp. NPDC088923 TaxID=3365913 RepID=UPI00381190F3
MPTQPQPQQPPGSAPDAPAAPTDPSAYDTLARLLATAAFTVLTGAGISTESGIPDYRGPAGSLRHHTPMTYEEFTGSEEGRRRYWARSHAGWRRIWRAAPNAGHYAVEALRRAGFVNGVITQNVDGLHRAAGTREAVELHGGLDRVSCLDCGRVTAREELDGRLRALNGDFGEAAGARINPDGDVELPAELVRDFRIAPCAACGGVLKPDVVFFGESVPKPRVRRCFDLVDAGHGVLVLGSSLTVMSGLRFVRHAARAGKPVVIINQGPTRGDDRATLRLDLPLGTALPDLAHRLGARLPTF